MHRDSDDAAQRLVGSIELRLAEYSDDHLTDEGLDRELRGLIAPTIDVVLALNSAPLRVVSITGSDSSTNTVSSWQILVAQAA